MLYYDLGVSKTPLLINWNFQQPFHLNFIILFIVARV